MIKTDFLFAQPSFIRGASRILDIGATLNKYNTSQTDEEADNQALQSDWMIVGYDMVEAIDEFEFIVNFFRI